MGKCGPKMTKGLEQRKPQGCPRCGHAQDRLLALSRRDNKTMVCDSCGTLAALEDAKLAPPYEGEHYRQEKTEE